METHWFGHRFHRFQTKRAIKKWQARFIHQSNRSTILLWIELFNISWSSSLNSMMLASSPTLLDPKALPRWILALSTFFNPPKDGSKFKQQFVTYRNLVNRYNPLLQYIIISFTIEHPKSVENKIKTDWHILYKYIILWDQSISDKGCRICFFSSKGTKNYIVKHIYKPNIWAPKQRYLPPIL